MPKSRQGIQDKKVTGREIVSEREAEELKMTGVLPYRFTNDYLFRATLQTNEMVLRGLVSALLDMPMKKIKECTIENPIELGTTIDEKTYVLDVKILLNSEERINIELQVNNEGDWPERSLLYLCRSFDNLPQGVSYVNVKKTIHIGILDFQLFPDETEFYAEYKMINAKTQKVYSDKFILRVLQLTQIEKVPPEERDTELYYWARLFKAANWEEVIQLAQKSEVFEAAASTIKKLTAEEKIRLQCEARERYEHDRASFLEFVWEGVEKIGKGREELEKGREELEKGKEDLEKGREELEKGKEDLEKRKEELEKEKEDLKKRKEAINKEKEEIETGQETGIRIFILDNLEEEVPKERIISKLIRHFELTDDEAVKYYRRYANRDGAV